MRFGPASDTRSKRPRRGKEVPDDQPPDDEEGVYWRSTMIDVDTRLRVGRGIAKTSGCGLRGGFSDAAAKPRASREAASDDQ